MEYGLRNIVLDHVGLQLFHTGDSSVLQGATVALLRQFTKVHGRGFVAHFDVDFRLHVDVVGYLVIVILGQVLLPEVILRKDVVQIALVLNHASDEFRGWQFRRILPNSG